MAEGRLKECLGAAAPSDQVNRSVGPPPVSGDSPASASCLEVKGHRRIRLEHSEAEALLDIEPDHIGVVVEIAD